MTAARPVTDSRLLELFAEEWHITPTQAQLDKVKEKCKRANKAPQVIQIIQEYCEYTPPAAFWESLEAGVTDLGLWEKVVSAYVLNGWNKQNLSRMCEFYQRGEIPSVERKVQGDAIHPRASYQTKSGNDVSAEGLAFARSLANQG